MHQQHFLPTIKAGLCRSRHLPVLAATRSRWRPRTAPDTRELPATPFLPGLLSKGAFAITEKESRPQVHGHRTKGVWIPGASLTNWHIPDKYSTRRFVVWLCVLKTFLVLVQ